MHGRMEEEEWEDGRGRVEGWKKKNGRMEEEEGEGGRVEEWKDRRRGGWKRGEWRSEKDRIR